MLDPARPSPGEPATPIAHGAPRTVLLIADNPDDRHRLSNLLEQDQWLVEHAGTIAEAGRTAARPSVILVDLNLPDGRGLDTVARVRSAVPGVPVVVLTGDNEESLGPAAVRAGAQDFLAKGQVDSLTLSRSLRHALERHWLVQRLDVAEAVIQERNRDLETLLHVTSHDLREPLRSIESFSRMTRERYSDKLDEPGRDYLDRVVRAAGRLNGLIDDIMRLSQARRAKVTPEPVDAASLVNEVLGRLHQRITKTGARVTIAPDLPQLVVDHGWVTQALNHLVGNALKFAPAGQAPDITISGYAQDGQTGLVVADRGPGIDPEYRERIFELFQRAVGHDVEGNGAGLAIVHQVALRHGGRAWMRPREGGGSEFVITFGRHPSSAEAVQPHGSRFATSGFPHG